MNRLALRGMQIGAIAVVLASSTLFAFDLDRFFVPKELVLHLTACVAALLALHAAMTRADRFLSLYLLLSALSALLATNRWIAFRALAISVSAFLIFRAARALRDASLGRPLLNALALAVVIAAFTSLLQTYGADTLLFSENRAPGGTLGNRNFVAHAAAFGFPLLMLAALRANKKRTFLLTAIGIAMVTASLVLTRSRAAWLAFVVSMLVYFVAILTSGAIRRSGRTWGRLATIFVIAAIGVGLALLLPNTLHWRGKNPYLESVQGVTDYESGSGRGRLIQYERSLLLALRHPLLGVGPGNWPVEYPARVPPNDPSLDPSQGGMTSNPWPSSDWIASIAERGLAATIVLLLAVLSIVAGAFRQLRAAIEVEEGLVAASLVATLAAAAVAGLFDAVLLLALPALIIWAAVGAMAAHEEAEPARWRFALMIAILISFGGTVRSITQLAAMTLYQSRSDRASLTRAASIDPGNYRLQLRLARLGGRQRCEHALAAHRLFPSADAARAASRGCGGE